MQHKKFVQMFSLMVFLLMSLLIISTNTTQAEVTVVSPDGCNSPTAYLPYNVGSKVQGKAFANCTSGYHTFQVCIKKDIPYYPDPYSCTTGNGNFSTKWLYTQSVCFGAGNYYTEATLDGIKVQSGRIYRNCN